MRSYAEVGYDGPERDGKPDLGNEDCNVPMNWMLLCKSCAVEFGLPNDAELETA
ncbi:hypothetical protein [Allochromatium vinosum]|nr:hypothetical protein [Allochromatium vinosum]